MEDNKKTVTIELSDEQYAFLTAWQKKHQDELGIEVPLTSMVRKAIDGTMKAQNKPEREERPSRPSFGDKPSFGDRGPRKSFGDKPSFGGDRGPRKSFGDRPSFGAGRPASRGPKFSMMSEGKRKFGDK